jgi:hypothetical protein
VAVVEVKALVLAVSERWAMELALEAVRVWVRGRVLVPVTGD